MNEQELNNYLNNIIEQSKYMLSYEDNWDDENSVGYSITTWKKTVDLVKKIFSIILLKEELIGKLNIYHSINGSIDILYENNNYTLLINIPTDTTYFSFFIKRELPLQSEIEGNIEFEKWKNLLKKINNQ